MRKFLLSSALSLVTLLTSCTSTSRTGFDPAAAQAAVEAVAKEHPDCVRLTVHCAADGAAGSIACASTAPEKKGKPSDPEDQKAMASGQPVVLEEAGALDVTVPILAKDGKHMAACGVTLKSAGMSREQVIAKASSIAKAVEDKLGSCCGDAGGCCCCSK